MKTFYLVDLMTGKHILSVSEYIEDLVKLYGDKKELLHKIDKKIVFIIDANVKEDKEYFVFDFVKKVMVKGDNEFFFNVRRSYANFNQSVNDGDLFYAIGQEMSYIKFKHLIGV